MSASKQCLENELDLLNAYSESLQNVLKIQKELSSLRRKSEVRLNSFRSSTLLNNYNPSFSKYITNSLKRRNDRVSTKSRTNSENGSDSIDTSQEIQLSFDTSDSVHNDVENLSMDFEKQLNALYTHIIARYVRDEKLLTEYFETVRNFREKIALSTVKSELIRLKLKKSCSNDSNYSLKKRQRALLMKLQHEYNEIKFMRNFQKKLSDDRKRILFRQLKHFKTMFVMNDNRKDFDLKCNLKSANTSPKEPFKAPIKCYHTHGKKIENNIFNIHRKLLFEHKKRLNDLLMLHFDLQINSTALNLIEQKYSNADMVDALKKLSRKSEVNRLSTRSCESIMNTSGSEKSIDEEPEAFPTTSKADVPSIIETNSTEVVRLNDRKIRNLLLKVTDEGNFYQISLKDLKKDETAPTRTERVGSVPKNLTSNLLILSRSVTNFNGDPTFVRSFMTFLDMLKRGSVRIQDVFNNTLVKLTAKHDSLDGVLTATRDLFRFTIADGRSRRSSDNLEDLVFNLDYRVGTNIAEIGNSQASESEDKAKSEDDVLGSDDAVEKNEAQNTPLGDNPPPEWVSKEKLVSGLIPAVTGVPKSSSQIDEAEELRKKQLAVELEIKALLEQQKAQMPYFVIREIPDKPPPPYIPPTDDAKLSVGTSTEPPLDDTFRPSEISDMVKLCHERIWSPFVEKTFATQTDADESFRTECNLAYASEAKFSHNAFLFDLCNESFSAEFRDINVRRNKWEYTRPHLYFKRNVCEHVEVLVRRTLGCNNPVVKGNMFVNCAHKLQDHVDELLIRELQEEEPKWVNVEEYEIRLKNSITDVILNSLIADTVREYASIYNREG